MRSLTAPVTLRGVTYTPPQGEAPFALASMASPKKRRAGLIAGVVAGVVVALSAATAAVVYLGDDEPSIPVAATSSPAVTPSAAAATPGITAKAACEQVMALSRAYPNDAFTVRDLPVIKTVADAAAAVDSRTIATQGRFLAKRVELADAGQKYPDGAKYMVDVVDSVRSLRTACVVAGYEA
jgi:hypothetical protein